MPQLTYRPTRGGWQRGCWLARAEGLMDVTPLTTTAADYFTRYGILAIPREDAPEAVCAPVESREARPETATVMALAPR